ncbi:chitin synthase, glycosyltransferase family 2 protein [Pseudohyphozyma bogoriensis]|nr:chitin synthase, glycosyltransferase family 2 protein [Pseudohyphozyma bogoriensis]
MPASDRPERPAQPSTPFQVGSTSRPPRSDPPPPIPGQTQAPPFHHQDSLDPSLPRVQFQTAPRPPHDRFPTDSSRNPLLDTNHLPNQGSSSLASSPSRAGAGASDPTLASLGAYNAPLGNATNSLSVGTPGALGYSASQSPFTRKKSLVRPDRARVDESDRLWNYRAHAAAMEAEGRGVAGVSSTGHYAMHGLGAPQEQNVGLRRGKSILAREEGMATETGLSMFKRGATLRRPNNPRKTSSGLEAHSGMGASEKRRLQAAAKARKEPLGPWMIYVYALTLCCPAPLLRCFGYRTKERQTAWREKVGLLGVVTCSMAAVGYLTFGFTESICGTPALRYRNGQIGGGSMIYHGYSYDFDKFEHPSAAGIEGGTNPLYDLFDAASKDGSFLFQNVNEHCLDIITPASGTGIVNDGTKMGWYFPCNLYNQWGSSAVNLTGYAEGAMCHTQTDARTQFAALKPMGPVYFTWDDLKNETRNLGVYDGSVLDFSLLNWLSSSQVSYPAVFDEIKSGNASWRGRDVTALVVSQKQQAVARCMVDVIRVGFIDSTSIGCVASDIVLYVSLVVILGVVLLRFFMAVVFGWFLSWRIGRFPNETYAERMSRSAEIENWTDDIYRPAPARYRPNVKPVKKMLPTTSRFSKGDLLKAAERGDRRGDNKYGKSPGMLGAGMRNSPPGSPGGVKSSRSSSSLPLSSFNFEGMSRSPTTDGMMGQCPFPLGDIIPQPPPDFEPFNYPLIHTFLLVTAYSESVEGLRTTLDSLATTDYPNSHKVILVIADGMVKGAGNSLTTPEIVLEMMKEFVVPPEEVEALSYVAIADGHKRHNKAKVFAGFYEYDNNTVEKSKQQRVPIMLVAKVGNDAEANDPKPGNRGKRDSQIVLMSFLQKVMFDERMTQFEYEFFNSLWRCTGVSPDRYETVLCVDADTKVFPDSVARMISCMVHDPEIMGLCGETKVANKTETWVTMMQVFEYYSAHHLSKAFESVFGGVTCLPGCFSMYRIKAPKGGDGYYVPILANPDIVEHYSENVVDTLHKKNLLLLGEDRYLTTLMLSTFPRRKMMFCPQAVCKTVVPDTFRVLLSQRRRWINSTVHNLFELFVVPDLCGVFCFSMRFVIFMELVGTLVLPAAISFTIYLVVVAIIPGTVKPTLSLILLAIILGIPGLLIVLTSRKVVYVGWMMIYLLSLPIWNFVLPMYAFFNMDDFSWGQTRKIEGDKGGAHGDKEGEFDSSHIVMKRWGEFERDRRYRNGTFSRDSTYDIVHRTGSPQRTGSNRYSVVSSVDTYISSGAGGSGTGEALFRRGSPSTSNGNSSAENSTGPRYPAQLELPAPLAAGSRAVSESSQASSADAPALPPKAFDDGYPASPEQAVLSNVRQMHDYPRYAEGGYDSDDVEREAILQQDSPRLGSHASFDSAAYPAAVYTRPGESPAPTYYSEPEVLQPQQQFGGRPQSVSPGLTERSESVSSRGTGPTHRRGVSLVDDGPVPGSQGVRVVQRQRRTSQGPGAPRSRNSLASPIEGSSPFSSPTSATPSLPPGAAPPRPHQAYD